MRVRWIGLTLALVLLGLAAGYGAGVLRRDEPTTFAVAAPVPASSPSIPVLPTPSYAPDVDYPPLGTVEAYKPHKLGDQPFQWRYDVPRGWDPDQLQQLEVRWRPADEPDIGGYSLRVKVATDYRTTDQMVAEKLSAVRSIYDDVKVTARTADQLSFTYRDGLDHKRYNTFRWFTSPGSEVAGFEVSVAGREVDVPGLQALLDHTAASVEKLA